MARKARVSAALVRMMAQDGRHAWTLEDLQAGLARDGTATDFSSVFRAAARLTAAGTIQKLPHADGRARFELSGAHHDHLHCTSCDELLPMPCVIRPAAFARLEAATGAAISGHRLVFTGVCRRCRDETGRRPR